MSGALSVTRAFLPIALAATVLHASVPQLAQQDLAVAGSGSPFYRIPALTGLGTGCGQ